MAMKVATGNVVRIEFELKVKGGEVVETSAKAGPLEYVQGEGKVLPGFEKRIEGMMIGEVRRGEIPPAEAFGTEESLPTKQLTRADFPKDAKLEVGMVFEAKGPNNMPVSFKVVKLDGDKVTVRFLHPLAGKTLEYWVKVVMIDDPKAKKRAVAMPPPPTDAIELSPDEVKEEK